MALQVENLLRDEAGKTRSILSRQFISFTYGGKSIEEFNVYDAVSTIHITRKSFFERIKSYFRRN